MRIRRRIALALENLSWRWLLRGVRIDAIINEAKMHLDTEVWIARQTALMRAQFLQLAERRDLQVELGCGSSHKPGWLGVDLPLRGMPQACEVRPDGSGVIAYDLRRGLPLGVNTCALIYSSHFFEHLEMRHGARLLKACFAALKPGGVLRLAMPNFRGVMDAYLRGDREFFLSGGRRQKPDPGVDGAETLIDHLTLGIFERGQHKVLYDEEKFLVLLRAIGFSRVYVSSYREELDVKVREAFSFYVEAVK